MLNILDINNNARCINIGNFTERIIIFEIKYRHFTHHYMTIDKYPSRLQIFFSTSSGVSIIEE